jgi:outer membrane protein
MRDPKEEGSMRRWNVTNILIALTMGFSIFAFPSWTKAADALRLATVDVQQIILESKMGKQAKAKVEAERDLKQKELSGREEEVTKLQKELEKQASILSEATRKEKQEAIDKKVRDLRRIYDDSNRDLQKKEGELIRDLLKDIAVIIRDYGKAKGYTLILEKGQATILYSSDQIDLTKEVITVLDAKTK